MRECRLLLILTGGTIGTAVSETGKRTLLQVGDGQEPLILQRLREERPDLSIRAKLRIPYQVLSEHMTVEHWERLLDCLREENLQAYDVVAITHGSDTLAYTAAFLDEALRGCPVPVFLVASQRPPEDPESNAIENFKATVETAMGLTAMTAQADASVLRSGGKPVPDSREPEGSAVYITYRNSDGVMYLHRGRELRQCAPGTDDFFSEGMRALEAAAGPRDDTAETGALSRYGTKEAAERKWQVPELRLNPEVLKLHPYVGVRYDCISLKGIRAVLHTLYHSSTAPKELTAFAMRCREEGVLLYILPCDAENYNYETTRELLAAGARPLQGITEETAYIRLLLGTEM